MTSFIRALSGASVLALASFTAPAAAEEADAERAAIVVTGTKEMAQADAQVRRTAGGADSVSAEQFDNKVAVSLRDALGYSAGIYTQPRFGQEVRISIRGSGLSRGYHMRGLTLLQDGIPINLADDNGDFQELDPMVLGHLEIYRGANALRYGGSTLGGAINGITPTGRSAPGVYLRADGGSFDTMRGLVSAGFADDRADAWFAVSGDRSDGDRDHARRKSLRFHGNIGLDLSETIQTRFYASYQNIDQELPGALTLNDAVNTPKKGNYAGDNARDIDSLRLQNRTSIALGDATKIDIGAFLNAKQLYHPIFQVIDQQSTDWGAFARADFETGAFAATIGTTARFGTVRAKRFMNSNGKRGAPSFAADQKARTIDIYGEARFKPVETLSLIAGGIYSHGKREQVQTLNSFAPPSAQYVEGAADFGEFSPKIGMLWEPRDAIQFYANYSRSAEMPGFVELAQIASFVPLRAQRAWTAEIGTRGAIGAIARWDISLYRADLKGEMLQFTVGADIPASTFNAGRTRHQGVEAALDITPMDGLRFRQMWHYADFRFRGDAQFGNNRLPVVPRHLYRAEIRLGSDRLNIAPSLEWMPQGAWADYRNTTRIPGYALLGLTAEAEVKNGISLFVDARNLTNRKAVGDVSAVIEVTNPAQQAIYYPVERRAFYGGVRARF